MSHSGIASGFAAEDLADLHKAIDLLESPSVIARLSNIIGSPLESAVKKLPASVSRKINGAVEAAMHKAASTALWSLKNEPNTAASTKLHKLYAGFSGAVGGAFGFTALFVELPISTTIMMRSVADVARSEGFNLEEYSTKQSCIEVFALGGYTKKDDSAETGYYMARGFFAQSMQKLSKELIEMAAKQGSGAVVNFTPTQTAKWLAEIIEKVAARFGVVITNKFAAQVVPVIGAVTGATINALFTDFYQDMARGHFIIKRLEQKYGFENVKVEYERLVKGAREPNVS